MRWHVASTPSPMSALFSGMWQGCVVGCYALSHTCTRLVYRSNCTPPLKHEPPPLPTTTPHNLAPLNSPLIHRLVQVVPKHTLQVQLLQDRKGRGRAEQGRFRGRRLPHTALAGAAATAGAAADGTKAAPCMRTATHLLDVLPLLGRWAGHRGIVTVVGKELKLLRWMKKRSRRRRWR